jgi:hypothetical protein
MCHIILFNAKYVLGREHWKRPIFVAWKLSESSVCCSVTSISCNWDIPSAIFVAWKLSDSSLCCSAKTVHVTGIFHQQSLFRGNYLKRHYAVL